MGFDVLAHMTVKQIHQCLDISVAGSKHYWDLIDYLQKALEREESQVIYMTDCLGRKVKYTQFKT